ncbi:carbohydrate binding domain-containing protein [Anaerosporobacter sp.]|uniref:carbohydrate binding domain-containing protein n=1 Tax=Anaerosporobacter sp. TaxID=1872529 RepID=UPI00286F22D1|nr:carbohydrate binding domain-containing protein [Anaerosporobacter sp.]
MFSKISGNQKNIFKRLLVLLLVAALSISSVNYDTIFASSTVSTSNSDTSSVSVAPTEKISDGAILHAFCWSFNTIKANMKSIADAGYSSIQTSPINAVDDSYPTMKLYGGSDDGKGGCWWWHYQPTDWTIGNYQLGSREEFKAMCAEADKYGIKIVVDVVPNHTANNTNKVSSNLKNSAGGNLYHSTGFTKCNSYSNRLQCTRYSMDGGLPDVDTENWGFQNYFINFLNDCIACGADGFRYDTAKHIGLSDDDRPSGVTNNFWSRVTKEITNASNIFNYGEVLQGDNERLDAYVREIGSTTTSSYGSKIRSSITSNNLNKGSIQSYDVPSGVNTSDLVTWVESHDNYINDGTWSQLNDEQVKLAWAVISARKDGAPLFFSRPNGGGPSNKWGTNQIGIAGSDLYKDDEVAAVNKFRNAMVGQSENLENPNGDSNVLMIQRGTIGNVIVNAKYNSYYINCQTQLQDGTYYSITDDHSRFEVKNHIITGTIPARSSVVLMNYTDNTPSVSLDNFKATFTSDSVTFTLKAQNTASAYYKVNANNVVYYTNGEPLTIGAGDPVNTEYKITLTGVGSDGTTVTQTYNTKKVEQGAGTTIYFEKPSSWSDSIYAYVYDESGTTVQLLNAWPGTAMQKESTGLYSLTFTEDFSQPLVIFNDKVNQVPAAKLQGFAVEDNATYNSNGKKQAVVDNSVTIFYKTTWSNANIHYQVGTGAWTTSPGVAMSTSNVAGYKTITIDLGTSTALTACFNNGSGTWDNNNKLNYTFTTPGTYTINDGNVTSGEPSGSSSNTITVYYYTTWSSPNIHYQVGNDSWTSAPGVRMSSSVNGYKVITIDLGTNTTLKCCFNDGNNNWDNNGGNNYALNSTGTYSIKNGTITNGTPQ